MLFVLSFTMRSDANMRCIVPEANKTCTLMVAHGVTIAVTPSRKNCDRVVGRLSET